MHSKYVFSSHWWFARNFSFVSDKIKEGMLIELSLNRWISKASMISRVTVTTIAYHTALVVERIAPTLLAVKWKMSCRHELVNIELGCSLSRPFTRFPEFQTYFFCSPKVMSTLFPPCTLQTVFAAKNNIAKNRTKKGTTNHRACNYSALTDPSAIPFAASGVWCPNLFVSYPLC